MRAFLGFLAGMGLVALGALPALGASVNGLQVCRKEGFVQPAQGKITGEAIRLPALIGFDDWGREGDPNFSDHRWSLTVVTLKPIELAPGQRCAIVPARITPSSKVRSVSESDHRHFEVDGLMKPNGKPDDDAKLPDGWDAVQDLDVEIVGKLR